MHHLDDLARYKERVRGRVTGSENGHAAMVPRGVRPRRDRRRPLRHDLDRGPQRGPQGAALAETFERAIAPHDGTGPVLLGRQSHLVLANDNALVLETVRAHYRSYYRDRVTTVPRIGHGFAYPLDGPSLGTALLPEMRSRTDVAIRRTWS